MCDIDMVRQNVRLRGRAYVPEPHDGEPLAQYALRCMEVGAMLAVEPVSALTLVSLNRQCYDSERVLSAMLTAPPPVEDPLPAE